MWSVPIAGTCICTAGSVSEMGGIRFCAKVRVAHNLHQQNQRKTMKRLLTAVAVPSPRGRRSANLPDGYTVLSARTSADSRARPWEIPGLPKGLVPPTDATPQDFAIAGARTIRTDGSAPSLRFRDYNDPSPLRLHRARTIESTARLTVKPLVSSALAAAMCSAAARAAPAATTTSRA